MLGSGLRNSVRKFALVFAMLIAASCSPKPAPYVFRNDDRPAYSRTTTVGELNAVTPGDVTLVDVRLSEDFAASPAMIPGAVHLDPEDIARWAASLPKDKPVVVYCVKGKWVSQKAATYLTAHGYDVHSLDGGINAWSAAALPTVQ
jgi:rhodanese-related sulfurtransferase